MSNFAEIEHGVESVLDLITEAYKEHIIKTTKIAEEGKSLGQTILDICSKFQIGVRIYEGTVLIAAEDPVSHAQRGFAVNMMEFENKVTKEILPENSLALVYPIYEYKVLGNVAKDTFTTKDFKWS